MGAFEEEVVEKENQEEMEKKECIKKHWNTLSKEFFKAVCPPNKNTHVSECNHRG